MKVLVVDDVGYSRHYHSRLLEKFGYETDTAESGQQALDLLERDMSIKIVLTDLIMREMDGVELYKRSLKIDRLIDDGTAEPPAFVLMTALRPGKDNSKQKELEKLNMAKVLGFVDVLYKPIEPETLKNTLEIISYMRSGQQIDTSGTLVKVRDTIDKLIAHELLDDAEKFLDEMRDELEKLDRYVSQLA